MGGCAMTHPTTQDQWRKKLVRMMPRDVLNSMIDNLERPWVFDRIWAEQRVMANLTDDDVEEMLAILRKKVLP